MLLEAVDVFFDFVHPAVTAEDQLFDADLLADETAFNSMALDERPELYEELNAEAAG